MDVIKSKLQDALLIQPKKFGDHRGFFVETYQETRYREIGIKENFVQDNCSASARGVLRGLHFQQVSTQGKLVQVIEGEVFDVAVDIRLGSPTFGQWQGVLLTAELMNQFWVPSGFAHGFCVVSERAIFTYKCTDFYHPASEISLLWNDPDLAIEWPVKNPALASKDEKGLLLRDIPKDKLPKYHGAR